MCICTDDCSEVIRHCIPKTDGGYSHSRVVLARTVQPRHKMLLSCPSASDGVYPNGGIELLAARQATS